MNTEKEIEREREGESVAHISRALFVRNQLLSSKVFALLIIQMM